MRRGIPNLLKDGTRHRSGLQEAVLKNLEACKQLADITRTSMGPNGQTTPGDTHAHGEGEGSANERRETIRLQRPQKRV